MAQVEFTPVNQMSLEALYQERLGLDFWSEVLGDKQPERTQERIDELSHEIAKREGEAEQAEAVEHYWQESQAHGERSEAALRGWKTRRAHYEQQVMRTKEQETPSK